MGRDAHDSRRERQGKGRRGEGACSVHGLTPKSRTTDRARQGGALASDLEVDAPLGRVELYALHDPWPMQTKCGGEQRFDADAHPSPYRLKTAPWTCGQAQMQPDHMPTGLHDQGAL